MRTSVSTFRKFFYYLVVVLATLTVVVTLLSLLYSVPLWWLKVLDFPRPQTLALAVLFLALFALLEWRWTWGSGALAVGLLTAIGWQLHYVLPYTPLVAPAVADATPAQAADSTITVSLLQANVLMKNRDAADLLTIVRKADPDMVLLEETNQWWERAVQALENTYPYRVKQPFDNTYGMLLYSRRPLRNVDVRFFQHPDVPSFHMQVQLPNGQFFNLHTMHPVPPVPSKHPYNKHQKEQEIVDLGNLVDQQSPPTLVIGDFNDVAWSNTNRLFQAKGRMNDARVGRGLYPTFDAKHLLLRWPLDQVYVSSDFRVVNIERLPAFGSDHFPLYVKVALPKP